jgi:hypothetical protein
MVVVGERGGSFEPGDAFDVHVVVYHGVDERELERRIPM